MLSVHVKKKKYIYTFAKGLFTSILVVKGLRMGDAAVCSHSISVVHFLGNFSAKNKPVLRYMKYIMFYITPSFS